MNKQAKKIAEDNPDFVPSAARAGRFPRWFRLIVRTLLLLLLLPIVVSQIPFVQNLLARKITAYLSEELQTKITLGHVWVGIFNRVTLDDFYIEDQRGDTLLFAGHLKVNHSGLFLLPFSRLKIESLSLSDATIRISKNEGDEHQNFQFILDYFLKDKEEGPPKKSKPFRLNLRHLYLENVHFVKPDQVKGEVFDVLVRSAKAHFDRFDLVGKRLELSALSLREPDVKISILPRKEEPPATPTILPVAEKSGTDTSRMRIAIDRFDLAGGRFSLHNLRNEPTRLTPPDILNFNYMNVFDIEVHIDNLSLTDQLEFQGEVEKIALKDSSGFVLDKLAAKEAYLDCNALQLFGLSLQTPRTWLGDTLIFRYDSYHGFEDFTNGVRMEGRFHGAYVALDDVMTFAPALESNAFFRENRDEVFRIDGLVRGEVNQLDARQLKITLPNRLELEGSFRTRNLSVPQEQFIDLHLTRLETNVRTLRMLIPGFNPPENVNTLGRLTFSGNFLGFFNDFVADGRLRSDIGVAEMNMNLKLKEGREKATYSGDLFLRNFDLGKWSGNPDVGKITFSSHVEEGKGLNLSTAQARLRATIDSLRFKGYDYKNATFVGQLASNLLDGDLTIADENINLSFLGKLNFADSVPAFDFKANIEHLALKPLNISPKDLQFSGLVDLSLKGLRLSTVVGDARVSDFKIIKNKRDTLLVESATMVSSFLENGEKNFRVRSNLGDVDITGRFDIEKIPATFLQFVSAHYPKFAGRLGIREKPVLLDTSRFEFVVNLAALQNLPGFLLEPLGGLDSTVLRGNYNGSNKELMLEIEAPYLRYQTVGFKDVYFKTKLDGNEGELHFGVFETIFSETQSLAPINLNGYVYNDTFEFLVISSSFFNFLDHININGVLSLEDTTAYRISFKPSDLILLNRTWEIDTSNYVRIGGGKVETNNFVMTNGLQRIILKSVRNEGLEVQAKGFPLDSLEFIQKIKGHRISGVADLHAKVKDIFAFQGLSALLKIDRLTFNGDNYGTLRLDASAPSIDETMNAWLAIQHDTMELTLDGYLNLPNFKPKTDRQRVKTDPLYFDFDLNFENYPAKILTYFVADVSDVQGSASATNISVQGFFNKPDIAGEVLVKNAGVTINTLRTHYRVPEARVKVTNTLFDATGAWVYDKWGNRASVEKGITHDHLRHFGLNVKLTTEPGRGFLGMETTPRDNPIFYGTAYGSGYAWFTGDFKQPNLYVNARSMPGTRITIPISNSAPTKEVRFISFAKMNAKREGKEEDGSQGPLLSRGLTMEFDLDITPDAQMELIFDKAWGDVLRGNGFGDLKVIITREGGFQMFGDYTVASGEYLFTLMNLLLNKPFNVEQGGTVTWAGDPYNASLDVNAVYRGLSTSVYAFIAEYLAAASNAVQDLARTSTPVNLKMRLKGNLLSPNIDFDLDFPTLDSELRNYAENKMRTIRQDPNELNRQVFGLLVLGQFLPSGYTINAQEVGLKTISEMLSNQLSIYITDFITGLFTDGGIIKGIDFDISYSRYTGSIDDATAFTGNELITRLKVTVGSRVSVAIGGNFDVGGGNTIYTTNNALVSNEFMIEYALTKDRRLRINAYNRTEPDLAGGQRNRTGVGFSFRKEFDSIGELLDFRRKEKK